MQQIVINAHYGGFGLSQEAMDLYTELCEAAGVHAHTYSHEIARDCPHLVETVRTLGPAADTRYSNLKVVEIPDGVQWSVHEYDGSEWVAENHRTWS